MANALMLADAGVFPEWDLIQSDVGNVGDLWDGAQFTRPPRWESLDVGRAEVRAAINAERDRREEAGFVYLGRPVDSDSRSVQRIGVAVQAAQAAAGAGQPFAIEWMCQDNTLLALDAAGMMGMPVALAMAGNALHQHARTLKAAVDAADSVAALEAIDVAAGWPG